MISLHTHEPIVITGIGIIASVGRDRESVWRAVRQGKSGVRPLPGLRGAFRTAACSGRWSTWTRRCPRN